MASPSYFRFSLAFRLASILCVIMVHCDDANLTQVTENPSEVAGAGGAGAGGAGGAGGGEVGEAGAGRGGSSTERAHNIGILIGIIFGSVAINIVTVFLIVYCLRGKRDSGGSRNRTDGGGSVPTAVGMNKRKSAERKNRYDELKDDYDISGTDKYPRVTSIQTTQNTEKLGGAVLPPATTDMSRDPAAKGSERKSATKGSRVSKSIMDDEDEEGPRRSSARGSAMAEEDEASSVGGEKKSSLFSRLSSSIKDRVSNTGGSVDARKSSARGSSAARGEEKKSSARISGERKSSARGSAANSKVSGRGGSFAADDEEERRSSARGGSFGGEERRSSARGSSFGGDERRSSARGSSFAEEDEAGERRSSARKTSIK